MPKLLAPPRPAPPPPPRPDPDAPPAVLPRMSREGYLAFDRAALELRYEWNDGEVRLMSGGTGNHITVGLNMIGLLQRLTADRPLLASGQALRTRVPAGPYDYPDVLLAPFPPEYEDPVEGERDTLTNPLLLAEVLSPSTAGRDRGEKRREYLRLPTVQNYLIVQPNVREVLRLTRHAPDPAKPRWAAKTFREADGAVELPRFGLTLPFESIYAKTVPGERIR